MQSGDMKIEGNDARIMALASHIQMLSGIAATMDLELLKKSRDDFQESLSTYEAIGIMDGNEYFPKLADKKARMKRIEAIINLIEILRSTDQDIIKKE